MTKIKDIILKTNSLSTRDLFNVSNEFADGISQKMTEAIADKLRIALTAFSENNLEPLSKMIGNPMEMLSVVLPDLEINSYGELLYVVDAAQTKYQTILDSIPRRMHIKMMEWFTPKHDEFVEQQTKGKGDIN